MNNISDRALFLLIGCAVGFVLGYIVRSLRIIETKIDKAERDRVNMKSDSGIVTHRVVWNTALFLVVVLTAYSAFVSQRANNKSVDAIDHVQNANVVSCQNSNETRRANETLWNFVVDISLVNQKNPTSAQVRNLRAIRAWIDKVYQVHDCNHLDKKYTIPSPPKLIPPR